MNNINELYNLWLEKATADPDLKKELLGVKGNDDEVLDRFYRSLEFGTAGLRGVIGAGTNRMNYYTVGRATQGLADFLNKHFENPSIAIGYDSRIKSEYFSVEAAKTLAANGFKVYLYEELEPTPCLSFAIRHFKTSSGIILTASHNPAKYNGYKCYNENGYQMTDEEASETYDFIQKVDYFTGIKTMDFDEAKEKELLEKEKALCALEEELKKREAELDAQSDKPPSKPKKRPNPLNSEARKLFEEHYQAIFSSSYYWSAKDAGNMSSLLKKLKFQREKKSLPTDDQGVLNALKYLLDSITDGWILENFSVTNINSKFNEIVSQAIAKKNGQTTSNTAFGQHRPDNRRASSGTDAENKRREREHLGNLADAILQQSASENSK